MFRSVLWLLACVHQHDVYVWCTWAGGNVLISRTIDNIGNEMAAQVLNDSCHRQRDKDAKKMMHNFYEYLQ